MSDATRTVLNGLDALPLRMAAEELQTLTHAEGFDPNLPIEGRLVLVSAAKTDNVDFVRILLEAGADPNLWDTDRCKNALGIASRSGDLTTLKLLLAHGADPNLPPIPGTSPPLSYATHRVLLVKELLTHGADPNLPTVSQRNNPSATPLTTAAQGGYIESVKLLLDAGADINFVSPFGTALALAVENGEYEVVKLLLSRGADPTLVAPANPSIPGAELTPLEIAKKKRRKAIIALFEQSITSPSKPSAENTRKLLNQIQKATKDSVRLRPPASAEDIAEAERATGIPFPDDLRAVYLFCDGEEDDSEGLFPAEGDLDINFQLISLSDLIVQTSQFAEFAGIGSSFLPFATDGSGDAIGFTPSGVGRYEHESVRMNILAASVEELLQAASEHWTT